MDERLRKDPWRARDVTVRSNRRRYGPRRVHAKHERGLRRNRASRGNAKAQRHATGLEEENDGEEDDLKCSYSPACRCFLCNE